MAGSSGLSREEKRELSRGLERLRSRLAVAVAAERKRLTLGSWTEYVQTEERARGVLRGLRGVGFSRSGPALDEVFLRLRSAPSRRSPDDREGEALRLRSHLAGVLDALESLQGLPADADTGACGALLVPEDGSAAGVPCAGDAGDGLEGG